MGEQGPKSNLPYQEPQDIPPTVIQDPAMAAEMAYGMKPGTEAAQAAMKAGRFGEAQENLGQAEKHGVEAAKRYLGEEREKLDKSEAQLEANLKPEDKESEPPETKKEAGDDWEESLAKLTPEQQKVATLLRSEISRRFEKFGMKETDLIILMVERDGEQVPTLVHTGPGIDIGDPTKEQDPARSYKAVMSKDNDKLFKIEIDGKIYDAREGMTSSAYDAKFQDAQDRGVTPPDSIQLAEETGDQPTLTMLTGEPLTADGYVEIGSVLTSVGGVFSVFRIEHHPEHGARNLRVCPAVEIK